MSIWDKLFGKDKQIPQAAVSSTVSSTTSSNTVGSDAPAASDPGGRIVMPDHPLFRACGVNGDMNEVQSLLQRKVNLRVIDRDGFTALHHASVFGRTEISKALIAAGAEVNAKSNDGSTPLFNAAKNGLSLPHQRMVEKQ
jgi:ankyrin repeat protein